MRFLVLTFIGDDRPGLVQDIAQIITDHGGNWLTSRMSQLDGKFAGLARISVDDAAAQALESALMNATSSELMLSVAGIDREASTEEEHYELDIVGHDRPGIIHEVTRALASHNLNLIEVASDVVPAAMTGQPLFNCTGVIAVTPQLDLTTLQRQLAESAETLGVDIQFAPASD